MSERFRRVLATVGALMGVVVLGHLFNLVRRAGAESASRKIELLNPVMLGYGLVFGCVSALLAVGLILVYRSSRVVNFAQAGFGAASVMLYLLLTSTWHWNWWLAVGAAVAAAALVGWLTEVFVVRRFSESPRLVLTVVTIALGQAIVGFTLYLPRLFGYVPDPDNPVSVLAGLPNTPPQTPFDRFQEQIFPATFTGAHLVAIAVALTAMLALAAFFRFSALGIAVRGSAENSKRAETLGINVSNLSSVVWVMAAVLAAVAAIVDAMVSDRTVFTAAGQGLGSGSTLGQAIGAATLLRALTAAVIARMERIPVAVAAAIGIAFFEQAVLWATGRNAVVDAVLLLVIIVTLLSQRARSSRVDDSELSSWASTEEIREVPSELRSLPQVRLGLRRALWTLAVVVAAYPWVMSPSNTSLGSIYAIYGIVGVSLVVLTGWGGQISLGQFGFVAVGAAVGGYTTATLGLPFLAAVVTGSVAAAVAAVAVGLPALRIKGLFLAVTTLAFALTMSNWVLTWSVIPAMVTRPELLWFDTKTDERSYYYLCVLGLAASIALVQRLRRTRTGRVLIGMRDNERAAQSYGINLMRTRLTAFAVSGALAGFAGVLYAHHQSAVAAEGFGPEQSIQMFLMAVIGGLGSVYAVIVGAIYLGTAGIVIDNAAGQLLVSGIGVLGILLFFPSGLGSMVFRARDAWLRRIALRNRIFVPTLLGDRLKEGEEALVPIVERLDEEGEVPAVYRQPSMIGDAGRSQLSKLWRY